MKMITIEESREMKRFFSIKLLFVALLFTAAAQGAWAQNFSFPVVYDDVWDGVTTTMPSETINFGDHDLIVINKAAELAYIRDHWKDDAPFDGGRPYYRQNYYLNANIDMGDKVSWRPMGATLYYFCSTFFGNGHTIRIHIFGANDDFQGLFTMIDRGTVKDLHVAGKIDCDQAQSVGAICGRNIGGLIQNCWVSADVSSWWHGSGDAKIGGICGDNNQIINQPYGVVKYCVMTGNVENNDDAVGGIVGYNSYRCTVEHCTFIGTRTSSEEQETPWIGDGTGLKAYERDLFDTFNQSEYENAISEGHNLYAYVIKYPYAINLTTSGDGAMQASAGGETGITRWQPGSTITLTASSGQIASIFALRADGRDVPLNKIQNGVYTFTMPKSDVNVKATFYCDWPTQGSGTEADPYLITSAEDWDRFGHNLGLGRQCKDQYVKLTKDISVTTMAGDDFSAPFQGTFDGDGHTLTVNYNTELPRAAPFRCVEGGAIKNLHTAGTITTSNVNASGLVGMSWGDLTITGCHSTVTINSSKSGEGCHGGFVGLLNNNRDHAVISGCVFDGAFATTGGTTTCGGFIGNAKNNVPTISHSLMKPSSVAAGMLSSTFASYQSGYEPNIINCYFVATANLPTDQGKQSRSVTPGDAYVTVEAVGPAGNYTYAHSIGGITAYPFYGFSSTPSYPTGITCGSTFYYGSGDEVSLTLTNTYPSPGDGMRYLYTASAGTLSGTTLTMPDGDVTISLDTGHAVSTDWETDYAGTQEDPYRIYFKEQLDLLAQRVNEGNSYADKYFKLMNDIEYSHTTDWDDATSTENNFTPIGNSNHAFCGDFDGNGHTISGIRIYRDAGDDENSHLGFFGYAGWLDKNSSANIHDLTLADARITGARYIGGIVGYNDQGDNPILIVTRCHVAANVAINAVKASNGASYGYGGIVGYNYLCATVSHCTSAATITAENGCTHFGAIAGYNDSEAILSDNLAIGATVPTATDNTYGAICGSNAGTIQRNYYIGCTVAGTANATGVGCHAADVTTNNGAVAAHSITGDEYVSVEKAGTTGFVYDDVLYAAAGEEVSLTLSNNRSGFDASFQASAGTLSGTENPYSLTMPDADVTISATSWALNGLSTDDEGNYLIGTADDWDMMVHYVASGLVAGFKDKTLKLTKDISVATMAGTDGNHTFRGTFDGQGYTLTVNYNTEEQYAAPFRYTYGCTIKNLKTAGTITTSNTNAGGVVGRNGTQGVTLQNVSSSVTINSSFSGRAYHGGLVGYAINATFEGCAFTGSLLGAGSHHCGGLLGQKSQTENTSATFTDCLFAPTEVTVSPSNSYTFAAGDVTKTTVTGCYYTKAPGDVQGTYALAISTATAPASLGNLVHDYGMIKAYTNGVFFGGTYYIIPSISAASATLFGEPKYVTTFYNGTQDYELRDGAKAYTASLDGDKLVFHLIGYDGSVIPHDTAVIIVSDSGTVSLFGLASTTVAAYEGNILQGSDVDIATPSGTVYVLGKSGDTLGFYKFTGSTIPAGKAYYVVE